MSAPTLTVDVTAPECTARGSDYAVLARRVREAGLLDRRYPYYAWKSAVVAAAWVAGWALLIAGGDSWWQLTTAAFLAAVFAQCAFLGHDAGHRQIFATRRANYLYGLIFGNLGIGVSVGWWTANHNRHHAHPNTDDGDPDAMGVLAFSTERARTDRTWRRFIMRYQAWLFFPLLLLEGGSLHAASARAVVNWPIRHRMWEGLLLATHLAGLVAVAFVALSPLKAVVFLALQQGLFGLYMGCTFAPNHKGMAVFSARDQVDFLRRQVLTSRNVTGGPLIDAAMGGLNYQIEHHLFPTMPRPNLRRAQPLVAGYCAELGVSYCEAGVIASYSDALRHLHEVGRPLREGDSSPSTTSDSAGWR